MRHIMLKFKKRSLLVVVFTSYTHQLINIQFKTFCFGNHAQKYALYLWFLLQTLRWGVFHSRSIHFFAFAFVMTVRLLFTFSFQYFFLGYQSNELHCEYILLLLLLLLQSHLRLDTLFFGYRPELRVHSAHQESGNR